MYGQLGNLWSISPVILKDLWCKTQKVRSPRKSLTSETWTERRCTMQDTECTITQELCNVLHCTGYTGYTVRKEFFETRTRHPKYICDMKHKKRCQKGILWSLKSRIWKDVRYKTQNARSERKSLSLKHEIEEGVRWRTQNVRSERNNWNPNPSDLKDVQCRALSMTIKRISIPEIMNPGPNRDARCRAKLVWAQRKSLILKA